MEQAILQVVWSHTKSKKYIFYDAKRDLFWFIIHVNGLNKKFDVTLDNVDVPDDIALQLEATMFGQMIPFRLKDAIPQNKSKQIRKINPNNPPNSLSHFPNRECVTIPMKMLRI